MPEVPFLSELATRRRFGMKPGLKTISALCRVLGNPETAFPAIHIAGTNGKGAVAAILDAALRGAEFRAVGRYTSPHLVSLNERFFLDGAPADDATLERLARRVSEAAQALPPESELTFFEALTAVAFLLYAERKSEMAILECGLGGRLDATNICHPRLSVITKIGLDHCDWLGETVEKIALEKAGIIKPGVPVVLGRNEPNVVETIRRAAAEKGAPFVYAPDVACEDEIPATFSLSGAFNRENAVTAIAALKTLGVAVDAAAFGRVVWPGRFQTVGRFIIDGAHNPPAARALAESLQALAGEKAAHGFTLVFGACGDKDVGAVLRTLAPFVNKAFAVRTNNPRSLAADVLAEKMRVAGIDAASVASLKDALEKAGERARAGTAFPRALVCGSLFLAGEALVALKAAPWHDVRFDPSERLKANFPLPRKGRSMV